MFPPVKDCKSTSKVFMKLENLDISNSSIDRVDHTEIESIRNICRVRALQNAKLKAIAVTKPLMQSVGNAINIADNDVNGENQLQGRLSGNSIRGYSSDKQKYEAPKIEFEKIKVKSSLSVKFILK